VPIRFRRLPVFASVALAFLANACKPELVVGTLGTSSSECEPEGGSAGAGSAGKTVDVPWTTGFENDFCDYFQSGGFCYGDPDASNTIVKAPVHDGGHAAAFSVTGDPARNGRQTRCFLEGALPLDAVYGAWFYLSASADAVDNWNLIHFQGGDPPPGPLPYLWDISLERSDDGSLHLYVRDFLNGTVRVPEPPAPVPIGSWFHVEFRLLRAADATGAVALYQDEVLLLEVPNILTDNTVFGQWYVGNLVSTLTPPDSTIYVDDVTIRAEP